MVSLFKSPIVDPEYSHNPIKEMRKSLEEPATQGSIKNGLPKFQSTMTWASDTSPIVCQSPYSSKQIYIDASPKFKESEGDVDGEDILSQFRKVMLTF